MLRYSIHSVIVGFIDDLGSITNYVLFELSMGSISNDILFGPLFL